MKSGRTSWGALTEWLSLGRRVRWGFISSPAIFNIYSKSIMHKAHSDHGVNIGNRHGRCIFNLGYADDVALITETRTVYKASTRPIVQP